MECLYCHKKFFSFRFWKSSEFCSEEHAEAYRSQTLSRLMDTGGAPENPSPAFEDALKGAGESHEIAPSEYTGARQLEPPAVSASVLEEGSGYSLPEVGTHALDADLLMGDLTSDAGSVPLHTPSGDDVDLQTPEEALNALRELARNTDRPSPTSRPPLPEPSQIEAQSEGFHRAGESTGPADDVDADDVFAELRRMAAASSGQAEAEVQEDEDEETIHLPMAPEGLSALDRLMETPTPSAGVGGPRLDRRLPIEEQADEPASKFAAKIEDIVEQDVPADVEAVQDQVPASAAPVEVTEQSQDEPPLGSTESADEISVEEQVSTEGAEEKVVSFPGPQQAAGRDGDGRRMARTRGATSGLFDSGIHEEFMAVDLSGLMREASGQPVKSAAVVLDEALKAPDQESGRAPMYELTPQGSVGAGWPTAAGDDLLAVISLRDVEGHPVEFAVQRHCEPYSSPIEPDLPMGLAQSMGVVPLNRGQLIRSELFIKEPEVRECAVERRDTTPEIDVRRAYYGRQGTA